MKRYLTTGCLTGLMVLVTGCSEAPASPDTHDADVKALKENEAQWVKDFAAKDVDKLVAHYVDDGVLMGAFPTANGKDAIRAAMKELTGDPAFALRFEPARVEVSKSGDSASTEGVYELIITDPGSKKPMVDKGSYVTTYKKQADGSWKAVFDINASSMAPGAPPAK